MFGRMFRVVAGVVLLVSVGCRPKVYPSSQPGAEAGPNVGNQRTVLLTWSNPMHSDLVAVPEQTYTLNGEGLGSGPGGVSGVRRELSKLPAGTTVEVRAVTFMVLGGDGGYSGGLRTPGMPLVLRDLLDEMGKRRGLIIRYKSPPE